MDCCNLFLTETEQNWKSDFENIKKQVHLNMGCSYNYK